MELFKVNGKWNGKHLARHVIMPIAGGAIVGWLANRRSQETYKKLEKPSFSPPPAVFPIVWPLLYGTMGLARYRVGEKSLQKKNQEAQQPTYNVQLGLNYLWSFLFFKWNLRGTALVEMMVLLGAIMLNVYQFYEQDRTAGTLLLPYLGWVCFAMALNYGVWSLNKA